MTRLSPEAARILLANAPEISPEHRAAFLAGESLDLFIDELKRTLPDWTDELFQIYALAFIAKRGLADEFMDFVEADVCTPSQSG